MRISLQFGWVLWVSVLLLQACSSVEHKSEQVAPVIVQVQGLAVGQEANYRLAQKHLQGKAYTKALPLLNEITMASPGYVDAWANLAVVLYGLQRYTDADVAINRALALANDVAELYEIAGLIQVELGHYKAAEAAYQKAVQLKPDCASCHYHLALLFDIYYQDLEGAIAQYQAYLDSIPNTDEDIQAWVDELKRNHARKEMQ